jgi:hypothetical protein
MRGSRARRTGKAAVRWSAGTYLPPQPAIRASLSVAQVNHPERDEGVGGDRRGAVAPPSQYVTGMRGSSGSTRSMSGSGAGSIEYSANSARCVRGRAGARGQTREGTVSSDGRDRPGSTEGRRRDARMTLYTSAPARTAACSERRTRATPKPEILPRPARSDGDIAGARKHARLPDLERRLVRRVNVRARAHAIIHALHPPAHVRVDGERERLQQEAAVERRVLEVERVRRVRARRRARDRCACMTMYVNTRSIAHAHAVPSGCARKMCFAFGTVGMLSDGWCRGAPAAAVRRMPAWIADPCGHTLSFAQASRRVKGADRQAPQAWAHRRPPSERAGPDGHPVSQRLCSGGMGRK